MRHLFLVGLVLLAGNEIPVAIYDDDAPLPEAPAGPSATVSVRLGDVVRLGAAGDVKIYQGAVYNPRLAFAIGEVSALERRSGDGRLIGGPTPRK